MKLRSLNASGVEQARHVLAGLRGDPSADVPERFLTDPLLSTELAGDLRLPARGEIKSRFQLGLWLLQKLEPHVPQPMLNTSVGLWTWLAFWMFDVVCPLRNGARTVRNDESRYILIAGDFRRSYRHLLAGPYLVVKAHDDNPGRLRALLAGRPDVPGEIYEQLVSRKEIITSPSVAELATQLYWNESRDSIRRGAGGKGPGSVRRLANYLMQIEVTHDLFAIPSERLRAILPREFSKFSD